MSLSSLRSRPQARSHPRRRPPRSRYGGLTVVCAMALIAACAKPPTTGGGEVATADNLPECPLDALAEASEPVEVAMWYGGIGGSTKATMEAMADRFNASQDRIRVVPSDQGASYQEVYRKYESAASSSTNQLPEILYVEDVQLPALIDGGNLLPAQSCMEADGYDMNQLLPIVRSTYTIEDVYYPGYVNMSTPVLYYNKAHWARAGLDPEDPPETLDELYEQAVALRDAGVSEKPFVLKLTQSFFKNWLNGVGVEMVNNGNGRDGPPTEATFDTDEARALLEFFQRMNDEGLLNVFSSTEGSIDHYLALVQQQSSMIVETSTASTTIRDALGGRVTAEQAGGDIDTSSVNLEDLVPGAAPFPGIDAPGQVIPGGGAFFILNTSDPAQQAASWKFLQFMLQPDNGRDWHLNGGYLPIVSAVQDDPQVQAFWHDDLAGLMLSNAVGQLQQADPDEPGPVMGPYTDFADEVQRAMEAVLLNGADIDQALARAQANVTAALERYAGE